MSVLVSSTEPQGSLSHSIKEMKYDDILLNLQDYEPKTKYLEHQLRSLAVGMLEDTYYFALKMGLGKTKIVIDIFAFKKHRGLAKRMFVLSPVSTLEHWKREVGKHSKCSVKVIEGSADEKIAQIFASTEDIVVCSMEWISTLHKKVKNSKNLNENFKNLSEIFDFLVLDECHKIKEKNTQLFKFCKTYLIGIKNRYLMSGTPIGNSYTNVWSQYYLMDKGELFGETYEDFLDKWFFPKPRRIRGRGWIPPEYLLKKELKNKFISLFWTKAINFSDEDCEYLPDLRKVQFPVGLNKQENDNYIQTLVDRKDMNSLEFDLMRFIAGCSVFSEGMPPVHAKQRALLDLLKRAVYEKSKVIVWHFLVDEGRMLENLLIPKFKNRVAFVRGETTPKDKKMIMEKWAAGYYDVLVTNPASLGTGVDLVEANVAIYFSNPADVIGRTQSEKRIHRTGQKQDCLIFDLVCPGTVDEYRYKRLMNKSDEARNLTQTERNKEIVKLAMEKSV